MSWHKTIRREFKFVGKKLRLRWIFGTKRGELFVDILMDLEGLFGGLDMGKYFEEEAMCQAERKYSKKISKQKNAK